MSSYCFGKVPWFTSSHDVNLLDCFSMIDQSYLKACSYKHLIDHSWWKGWIKCCFKFYLNCPLLLWPWLQHKMFPSVRCWWKYWIYTERKFDVIISFNVHENWHGRQSDACVMNYKLVSSDQRRWENGCTSSVYPIWIKDLSSVIAVPVDTPPPNGTRPSADRVCRVGYVSFFGYQWQIYANGLNARKM